jgi:hypothetical protein
MTTEAIEAFLHVQRAPAGPMTAGEIEAHAFTGDDYDRAMEAALARGRWPELDRLLAPVVLRGLRSAVEAGDVSRPDGARVLAHLAGMGGRPGLGASAALALLCRLQRSSVGTRRAAREAVRSPAKRYPIAAPRGRRRR